MATISNELQWNILRSNNNRVIKMKNGQPNFTREKVNVMALSTRKCSGMASSNGVGVGITKKGNAVLILNSGNSTKPKSAFKKVYLNTHGRGAKKCTRTVVKLVKEEGYRPQLALHASAAVSAIAKSNRRKAAGVKYVPKKRSNK